MKLHILMDFNKCETKTFTSAEEVKKCLITKEGEKGVKMWEVLSGEYLIENRYMYSTSEFSFTTALMTEMKDALEYAEMVLADPEESNFKGYTKDAKKKVFAVNDKIRRLQ